MMKPRHAAALALVGWYLMTPPASALRFDESSESEYTKLPINKWTIANSFYSSVECHSALAKTKATLWSPKFGDVPVDCKWCYQLAKCIASDDPRLKGN